MECDNKIAYLDMTLQRTYDNKIGTIYYQKPTTKGRLLHFNSEHTLIQRTNQTTYPEIWQQGQNLENEHHHQNRKYHTTKNTEASPTWLIYAYENFWQIKETEGEQHCSLLSFQKHRTYIWFGQHENKNQWKTLAEKVNFGIHLHQSKHKHFNKS